MRFDIRPYKVLDFDIENRPLSYWFDGQCTAEITAIAASFGPDEIVRVWLLGQDEPVTILESFRRMYDAADVVTGHYIRKHDLPIINGAMLEYGLPPLGPKMTSDTKLDLVKIKDMSLSQESLGAMYGLSQPKVHMTQDDWRKANRLQRIDLTRKRVVADVRQHQMLRMTLINQGMLSAPQMWEPGD